MSRRLQAEIDKMGREIKTNIEAYDEHWQELRRFNQTQIGVKERMWQEARREQMRGKKHAVRTATLELLDFKHVCDSKAKMESDLEASLRRLHRQKQQLLEWLNMSELRIQSDELRDWKKQIELRYKRGRFFYCLGQSSENSNLDDVELTEIAEQQLTTIRELIDKLTRQSASWKSEVELLEDGETVERKAQLDAFLDLHSLHIKKLAAIATNITSKGYSVSSYQSSTPSFNNAQLQLPIETAIELYEGLRLYIDGNDELNVVVAEEIYNGVPEEILTPDDENNNTHQVSSSISTISDVNETTAIDTDLVPMQHKPSVISPVNVMNETQSSTLSKLLVIPDAEVRTENESNILYLTGDESSKLGIEPVLDGKRASKRRYRESQSPTSPKEGGDRKHLSNCRMPKRDNANSAFARTTECCEQIETCTRPPEEGAASRQSMSFEPQLGSTGCLRATSTSTASARENDSGSPVCLKRRTSSSSGSPVVSNLPSGHSSSLRSQRQVQSQSKSRVTETNGRRKYSNLQLIAAIDQAACDWSYDSRGSASDEATANKTLNVREGDNLYIIKLDKSGWSFAFVEPRKESDDTSDLVVPPSSDILTPRRTHLKAEALSKLRGGWFPDSVRKSVGSKKDAQQKPSQNCVAAALGQNDLLQLLEKEKRLSFPCLEDISDFALSAAASGRSKDDGPVRRKQRLPQPADGQTERYVPLLERLQMASWRRSSSSDAVMAAAEFPAMRIVAGIEPQSLRVVQWPWNAGQMVVFPPCSKTSGEMMERFVTVRKGDRVWIDGLSEDGEWVMGSFVVNQQSRSRKVKGWFPTSQLVQPEELIELWDAVECITAMSNS